MAVTRYIEIEQSISDRIDMLNQPGIFVNSMPSDFLERSVRELENTARVTQTVYHSALQYIEEQVKFFEKQSELINLVHSFFTTLPPEEQLMYTNFIGNKKIAAYKVICGHLDPQFNPPWSHLNMGDVPELLGKVDSLLTSITQQGMNSPIVIEFLHTLSSAPFL